MAQVLENATIRDYQNFIKEVYGLNNSRNYSSEDILTNIERFAMRGLKGVRKKDEEKIKINLLISFSWFMSIMNQLILDLENEVWKRFPYACSYCGSCPCFCKEKKITQRQKVMVEGVKRPKTLEEFQAMFGQIYPPKTRTLEEAGIHLAEELGEFSETILAWKGEHKKEDFAKISQEAADFYSCFTGVFNSLSMSVAKELAVLFVNNCHACHRSPCECSFQAVSIFES